SSNCVSSPDCRSARRRARSASRPRRWNAAGARRAPGCAWRSTGGPARVTPDLRFRRVRALFEAALALPDAERTTFLARLRGEDAALRDEVGALLAADARVDDSREPPHSADEAANLVGRDVGGFHIVRQIGRGGMGTVWEAEQHAPRRRVALKAMHR